MPARLLTALLLACAILGRDGSPSRPEVGRDGSPSRPGIGRDGSPSRPTPQNASRQDGSESRPYLSPADALAAFQLEPGYRIDLVAAEPLVQDPIALAFDEHGALFVVENRGYPDPLDGQPEGPPLGRIARLTDADGDGRFDTRTEFATGLTYPNGIQPWQGGVFVTVAPDLLYLRDTDGDGVADERRVVLTGFNATRTAQIRFSHPTLGPDGWIYLTSGLNGGRVTAPEHPDRPPVEFSSSDSRFDPRTGAFELAGGAGQYGLTFDEDGRRFICSNRHPVWQVILEPAHLSRNRHLPFSETVQEVSTVGPDAKVWPLSADLTTASFIPSLMRTPHAGTFTSASGVHVHRGDALPDGHGGSLFIMESAQNLVQRQVRTREGVSFRSRPAREGVEFLASPDTWFRPVFATTGPDGALYVADMYRKDIDHPAYVPEEARAQFDFTAGREFGRIYRIAADDRPPARLPATLATASDEALVAALGDANGWQRETAQRLLIERGTTSVAPALRQTLRDGTRLARLHALWTLDALGVLEDADVRTALADSSAGIRENALRVAERRLATHEALLGAVLPLHADDDPRVRLHAALALGARADARRLPPLAAIARRDGADRWVRAAVLGSVGADVYAFYEALSTGGMADDEATAAVMTDLAHVVGASATHDQSVQLLTDLTAAAAGGRAWPTPALAGLARGLRTRDMTLASLAAGETAAARAAAAGLATAIDTAGRLSADEGAPLERRVEAIALLTHGDWPAVAPVFERLLTPSTAPDLQRAAVRAIAGRRDAGAAAVLVERARWAGYSPPVREQVMAAMLGDDRLVATLLDAVERGDVPAAAVGASRLTRLTTHGDTTVRTRAATLADGLGADAAMQAYEATRARIASLPGDGRRGAEVFEQHCVACHTFTSAGGRIGPDLSGIRNQPADALLLHIVVPDHELTPGYETYTVDTADGRTLFGRIVSEAPHALTLRDAAGQDHQVLRRDIAALRASSTSLMPVGLEAAMSAQDMADLLAHLKGR